MSGNPRKVAEFSLIGMNMSYIRFIRVEWIDGVVPGSFFSSAIFEYFADILDDWAFASPKTLDYFGGKSLMNQSHGQVSYVLF